MTEDDARGWIEERFGAARTERLARFAGLLIRENEAQNLIARSTLSTLWTRHLLDSAQLIPMGGNPRGEWVDIGSGAGLPGLVVGCLSDWPVVLIEPRARRVAFLAECIATLDLPQVSVIASKAEQARLAAPAGVISARAVASLPLLLAGSVHLSDRRTLWLLPKGQSAQNEVEAARAAWHGVFHVEQSLTDAHAGIVIAREVRRR